MLPRSAALGAAFLLTACRTDTPVRTPVDPTPTPAPPTTPPPPTPARPAYAGPQSVANFELLGGYRLDVAYASEGLAVLRDTAGFVTDIVAGAHAHTHSVHLYPLRAPFGAGDRTDAYPLLAPTRTWSIDALFPRWIDGQTARDMAIVTATNGFDLAAIGRVFYNTSPRPTTQISIRTITGSSSNPQLGATRELPVNLPEQEFSGFIKHEDAARDLGAIGAGAYDSGQGSVAGLSYAVRRPDGTWTRLLNPPPFGDLTAASRLPRDADYSCPDGQDWVCIPPIAGDGVWSTERIGGGGVRYGNNILFIATLGYGPRTYSRQSYTFGDPAQDRAVAYFFRQDTVTNAVTLQRYERWATAAPGELVIGTALGRVRGVNDLVLFVMKGYAWNGAGAVLQLFRIKPD
jgi:hypothetical protein